MNRLLILSYYAPPMGMGGVQRISFFAKYLTEIGWDIHMLTPHPGTYYAFDDNLAEEIAHIPIHRTSPFLSLGNWLYQRSGRRKTMWSPDRSALSRAALNVFRLMNRWLFIPDSKTWWVGSALAEADTIIQKYNIQSVLISVPPNSAALTIPDLKSRYDIRIILDVRDPWFSLGSRLIDHGWRYNKMLRLGRRVFQNADRIITVSQFITRQLLQTFNVPESSITYIPNGYVGHYQEKIVEQQTDTCTFMFIGSMTTLTDPEPFLTALRRYCEQNIKNRNTVRVEYLGISPEYISSFQNFKRQFPDVVIQRGYVPYDRIHNELHRADYLLFTLSPKCYNGHITGRLFELLASGTPIFAIVPHGEAAELIDRYGRGFKCHPDDAEKIYQSLEHIISGRHMWNIGRNDSLGRITEFRKRFHRFECTKQLHQVLTT